MRTQHVQYLSNGLIAMLEVLKEWVQAGFIPEVSWGKTRRLEFQEVLRHRDALAARLDGFACTQCPSFEQHVGLPQVG